MNKARRVVVTAMSVMNCNGNNKEEFFINLLQGKVGIDKCTIFNTKNLCTDYVGEIKRDDFTYEIESIEQDTRVICIFKELVNQLFEDSDLSIEYIRNMEERACMSVATSVGSDDYIIEAVKNSHDDLLAYNQSAEFAKICGVNGTCYTNVSACSAGTTAAGTAYSLIKSGRADLVITGGLDPLTEFSCYGFHSLQNMSDEPCTPFDVNRKGINIGEGGALFIFEDYENAKKRKAKIYAEICGYGLGNDAYHPTSPDPSGNGALRVMKSALSEGNISPNDIDYINAHGTGTILNDSMELKAISNLNSNKPIDVSSTKSMTGHCLAGAGAIELAASIFSICNDSIFPTANLKKEDSDYENINLIKGKAIKKEINTVLSNSFAFGGNSSSILLRKVK